MIHSVSKSEQMAEQEELQPLRSLHSLEPSFVSFQNRCSCRAEAWWLDFAGAPVSYGEISPGQWLRMNTYQTHPWIFRASDGSALLIDSREVYFPSAAEYREDGHPLFRTVTVTSPVYSLQEYCLKLIRKLVRDTDIDRLEIPGFLKKELHRSPDLLRDIQTLRAQRMSS
ncbi:von Hippel-Lindau-like protein [Astyanax mexicanus]|uniref:von Hippel-Lindau-like protein n=1 Tax=Astyanax mexicanus TaxID=7994 RepID=UPI0020CABDA7|nr:von Hippel-Lindau-like protein [Astyanax mexicanus]